MKKLEVLLSSVLVLTILSLCFVHAFAAENNVVSPEEKISSKLAEKMAEADEDELIPVWIWYQDIDQGEVDELTEQAVGYKEKDLDQSFLMPDVEQIYSIRNNSEIAEGIMREYLENTAKERAVEYYLTDQFIMKRREISREKYNVMLDSIINEYDILSDAVFFKSQYSPVLIIMMTQEQINEMSCDNRTEYIGYYSEQEEEYCTVQSAKITTKQAEVESVLGLTGDGVKVGMVDVGYPDSGTEIDLNDIIKIGNPSSDGHATNTATAMVGSQSGFARDIILYSTDASFENIELMISAGIKLMNVSFGWIYFENDFSSEYSYSFFDRWFDHIVAQHKITVVASAGNDAQGPKYKYEDGTESEYPYRRVLSPAMGHNVIAVGAFTDNDTGENLNDDQLENYSSYKNTNGTDITTGVEKPDVVIPSNLLGSGTSTSAPVLTSLIAQILQLKPSLSNFPQAVKAIVLASCHRKAAPSTDGETLETMEAGITERQGAGIPNAWIMAAIVSQGTYGYGTINSENKIIEFKQPAYDAEKLNVSITWLTNNHYSSSPHNNNLIIGQERNLDLNLYCNNILVDSSNMLHSSTELCYLNNISNTDSEYKIEIVSDEIESDDKYGFAWSTNNMRASSTVLNYSYNRADDGIYGIKTSNNQALLRYDPNANQDYLKPCLISSAYQGTFADTSKWILSTSSESTQKLSIKVGYGYATKYLGISDISIGSYLRPTVSDTEISYWIVEWDDGTCSIVNDNYTRILSYHPFGLYWDTFSYGSTIQENQKWNLYKSNYIKGDSNVDGQINSDDGHNIQQYLASLESFDNIEMYLSDLDHDGVISVIDSTLAYQMLNNNYLY